MSTMSTTSRKFFSSRCFLCLSEYARYGENGDLKYTRIWPTLREILQLIQATYLYSAFYLLFHLNDW